MERGVQYCYNSGNSAGSPEMEDSLDNNKQRLLDNGRALEFTILDERWPG